MLETLDLSLKLGKKEFEKQKENKMERLGELQRLFHSKDIPIIILFEGWTTAGKGEIINALVQALDPRGFKVHTPYFPTDEERVRPFFWRFWNKLPQKGQIAIFDRSWYWQTLSGVITEEIKKEDLLTYYNDITDFERLLSDDQHIIFKFFTHISEKEFKSRRKKIIKQLEKHSFKEDVWEETDLYGRFFSLSEKMFEKTSYDHLLSLYEEMFRRTDSEIAPWVAVESTDIQYAQMKVLDYIINVLERKWSDLILAEKTKKIAKKVAAQMDDPSLSPTYTSSALSKIDLTKNASKEEYKEKMDSYQKKLRELQFQLFEREIPMILLFEGWDAAGKGGNIKRVTSHMDPRAYYVSPTSAPGYLDKRYHYLWRFWQNMPAKGLTAIFDRTWYGRVMVERVEGFASEEEWRRAYREINEMEDQLIHSNSILLKFWLQIDKDEQLRRFEEREKDSQKNWKITEEDWRNREKWDEYEIAINEMLFRTSTAKAPWTIVEANDKRYGRLKVMKTIIDAIENKLS